MPQKATKLSLQKRDIGIRMREYRDHTKSITITF